MRRLLFFLLLGVLSMSLPAAAATGRVIKVLPHFLDRYGQRARSPSLYDRDAYQAWLRQHPKERSGISFDVQWKTRGGVYAPLKLRVEMIGTAKGDIPARLTLEKEIQPSRWFSRWTSLPMTGDDYKNLGDLTAWRVTLWEGNTLLAEEKSFLW